MTLTFGFTGSSNIFGYVYILFYKAVFIMYGRGGGGGGQVKLREDRGKYFQ